jgi:hypothetical protein
MKRYCVVHIDEDVPKLTYLAYGDCDEHWTDDKELAKKTKREMTAAYPYIAYKIFKVDEEA